MNAMKLTKEDYLYIFEMALVISVSFSMLLYGIGKPLQFSNSSIAQKPVSALTGMELMWAFYGYSKVYPLVLGFFEIMGALLLLFRKTRLLGGLVITSILFNVILQDIFYGVNVGALRAAIVYQVSVLIIFWLNRKPITQIMQFYFKQFVSIPKSPNKWLILVLAGVGAVLLKVVEAFLTH
jgi:hypothetical protein